MAKAHLQSKRPINFHGIPYYPPACNPRKSFARGGQYDPLPEKDFDSTPDSRKCVKCKVIRDTQRLFKII